MIDVNKAVANLDLILAIEAMKLDGSPENLDRFINEVMRARFLSPVTISPFPEFDENGDAILTEDTTVSFHLIGEGSGNSYFPAFSGWEEFKKWSEAENMQTMVSTFDDFASMVLDEKGESSGFVIDPFGASLPFSHEMIDSLKKQKDRLREQETAAQAADPNAKILLGKPNIDPEDLIGAIGKYFKTQKSIQKAYLLEMVIENTGESSYLLVIDMEGDHDEILDGIAEAVEPYLGGMPLNMVPFDTELGKNASERTEPFYKRKKFGLFPMH
jgi:hypothetical protein